MESVGIKTPTEAADRFREINKNTITSNLNGNRPVSKKAASTYARLFGCTAGWILYGEGPAPGAIPKETENWINRIKLAATEAVISGVDSNDVVNALLDVIATIRQISEQQPDRIPLAKEVVQRAREQSRNRKTSDTEDNGAQR